MFMPRQEKNVLLDTKAESVGARSHGNEDDSGEREVAEESASTSHRGTTATAREVGLLTAGVSNCAVVGAATAAVAMGAGGTDRSFRPSSSLFSPFEVGRKDVDVFTNDANVFSGCVDGRSTSNMDRNPRQRVDPHPWQLSLSSPLLLAGEKADVLQESKAVTRPGGPLSQPSFPISAVTPAAATAAATATAATAEVAAGQEGRALSDETVASRRTPTTVPTTSTSLCVPISAQQQTSMSHLSVGSGSPTPIVANSTTSQQQQHQQHQQPFTCAAAMSLPNWANHPPALPGLDATSSPSQSASNHQANKRKGFASVTVPRSITAEAAAAVVAEAASAGITRHSSNIINASACSGRIPAVTAATAAAVAGASPQRAPETTRETSAATAASVAELAVATAATAATATTAAEAVGGKRRVVPRRAEATPPEELQTSLPLVTAAMGLAMAHTNRPFSHISSDSWLASVSAAWVCAADGCSKPADYEVTTNNAKRLRGVVTSAAAAAAAAPEGGVSVGCRAAAAAVHEAQEKKVRWCAAHRPAESELSRETLCSFPRCRSRWGWGHGPATKVDGRKSTDRCCTQHSQKG